MFSFFATHTLFFAETTKTKNRCLIQFTIYFDMTSSSSPSFTSASLDKLCILTSGRTGSTFIIDALQKSGHVYALSEMLRVDYIPNHFDISDPSGFLNKRVSASTFQPKSLADSTSFAAYVQQFLDDAAAAAAAAPADTPEKNYLGFVFKIVFESNEADYLAVMADRLRTLQAMGFQFCLLTRNIVDTLISAKKCEACGQYSNFDTTHVPCQIRLADLIECSLYHNALVRFCHDTLCGQHIEHISYEEMLQGLAPDEQMNNIKQLLNKLFCSGGNRYDELAFPEGTRGLEKQNRNNYADVVICV